MLQIKSKREMGENPVLGNTIISGLISAYKCIPVCMS